MALRVGVGAAFLIGCTSLQLGIPVLTANLTDFRRVDGLGVVSYR